MTKAQKISSLKASYRHESKALAQCKDSQFATADEQKKAVCQILSGIEHAIRKLERTL